YKAKAMPVEVLSDNYTGNAQLYKQEKVLWTTATSSYPTELKTDNPGLIDKTVVTKRMGEPPLFVQGIAVSAKSKAPAAALAFAKFATNTENQIEFVKLAQGFLPGT
nr:extracellular solute-binding protein [Enterococcus faecalis]